MARSCFLIRKIIFWTINTENKELCRPYFPITNNKSIDKKDKKEEKPKEEKKKGEENKDTDVKETKGKKNYLKRNVQSSYTQSTFLYQSEMAITATSIGEIIVWDVCPALCKEGEAETDRRKIKTVELNKSNKKVASERDKISVLINYETYIVIGSGDGSINFYSYDFIIVRWFDNKCWLVTSISFDMSDDLLEMEEEEQFDADNKEEKIKFRSIPFIVSDVSASIKRFYDKDSQMIGEVDNVIEIEEIYKGIDTNITSISVHPSQNYIAYATDGISKFAKNPKHKSSEGLVKEKRFEPKPMVCIIYFPKHMGVMKEEQRKGEIDKYFREFSSIPNVIEYSPNGIHLCVGFDDGEIFVFPDKDLSEPKPVVYI